MNSAGNVKFFQLILTNLYNLCYRKSVPIITCWIFQTTRYQTDKAAEQLRSRKETKMIYVIAILLLILVLANDSARALLGSLIGIAIVLALAGGLLIVLFLGGAWLFESKPSTGESMPALHSIPSSLPSSPSVVWSPTEIYLAILFCVGVLAFIVYDYRKLKK